MRKLPRWSVVFLFACAAAKSPNPSEAESESEAEAESESEGEAESESESEAESEGEGQCEIPIGGQCGKYECSIAQFCLHLPTVPSSPSYCFPLTECSGPCPGCDCIPKGYCKACLVEDSVVACY